MSERVLHLHRGLYRATPDPDLIRAISHGDNVAMEELFGRHVERVHRILARLRSVDAVDVEDLVQSAFLEVQRSAHRYDGRSAVGTWIVGIAINVMRHHVRGEIRRRTALSWLLRSSVNAEEPSPFEASSNRQALARIQDAFQRLTRDHKEVFLLCDVEGMRGTEVARVLSVPEGTVWRRLHEARLVLRRHMVDTEAT